MSDANTPLVSISQHDLQLALSEWEAEARAGNWPAEPHLSPDEVARRSAAHLFALLQRIANPAA
jgi:hypothetical protein